MIKRLLSAVALLTLLSAGAIAQPVGGAKLDFGSGGTGCCNQQQLITQTQAGATKNTPLTGATITLTPSSATNQIIAPAGTIATLTLALPQCAAAGAANTAWTTFVAPTVAADGFEFHVTYTQTVTALTITAAGGSSLQNGIATSGAAGTGKTYHCNGADTTWYQF